jgi:hypothetical protein
MNYRPSKGDVRAVKPVSEQVLNEIIKMRRELAERLDRLEDVLCEDIVRLRHIKDRIDKIERATL